MKDRLDKIAAYAGTMADLYFSADQKIAILDGVNTPDIAKLLDRSYGAHAYQALLLTLLLDVIRDMWASLLDPHEDSPSLRNVARLLQADDLRSALRAKNTEPPKATWINSELPLEDRERFDQYLESKERARRERQFDETWNDVSEGVPALLGSPVGLAIDKARKKAIAHYDMQHGPDGRPQRFQLSSVGLKWGDPAKFLAQAEGLIFDAVLLATNGSYDIAGFKKANRLYAEDFWSRLMGNGPVNETRFESDARPP